jgi:NTP pyrophosphatase (non-canonical NTP hydrolase)
MPIETILNHILDELNRQNEKWGEQNHDNYTWLAILTEEVGELSQAILHDEYGGRAAGNVKTELEQVAAVAVQWLESIERRRER